VVARKYVLQNSETFSVAEQLAASQGISFMKKEEGGGEELYHS
jgi:hypothetical protein